MEYRIIDYVDKPISKIVFGCAGKMMNEKPKIFQSGKIFEVLDAALEAGINTFDTAENYGASENILGRWIKKRGNRKEVVIISKGCHPYGKSRVTVEELKNDLEQSFNRLQTDYIDIYMLHRDCPEADIGAILEVLNKYHDAGKIKAFGVSNWKHTRIEEANCYAAKNGLQPFSVASPNFGPASQVSEPWGGGCVSIAGPTETLARKWYEENHIPVFAYSCLGRGLFSGKVKTGDLEKGKELLDKYAVKGYWCQENIDRLARIEKIAKKKDCTVSQVSLAWMLQQPFEVFPIVTMSNIDRIIENVKAIEIVLSVNEIAEIAR